MRDAKDLMTNKTAGSTGLGKGAMKGSGMAGDNYKGKGSKGNMSSSPKVTGHNY